MASTDPESVVTISSDLYGRLLDSDGMLCCLELVGVDNWEGYETALQLHNGEITKEDI